MHAPVVLNRRQSQECAVLERLLLNGTIDLDEIIAHLDIQRKKELRSLTMSF
jgi:hypothetical protein